MGSAGSREMPLAACIASASSAIDPGLNRRAPARLIPPILAPRRRIMPYTVMSSQNTSAATSTPDRRSAVPPGFSIRASCSSRRAPIWPVRMLISPRTFTLVKMSRVPMVAPSAVNAVSLLPAKRAPARFTSVAICALFRLTASEETTSRGASSSAIVARSRFKADPRGSESSAPRRRVPSRAPKCASAAGLVAVEDLARGGQQLGPDRGRVQDLDLITESGQPVHGRPLVLERQRQHPPAVLARWLRRLQRGRGGRAKDLTEGGQRARRGG